MLYYVLAAVVVAGLAYWFLKSKKGSGPSDSQPMPPPSQPPAPTPPQM